MCCRVCRAISQMTHGGATLIDDVPACRAPSLVAALVCVRCRARLAAARLDVATARTGRAPFVEPSHERNRRLRFACARGALHQCQPRTIGLQRHALLGRIAPECVSLSHRPMQFAGAHAC